MPPLVPASLISLVTAASGPTPSVCTCVFVHVAQGAADFREGPLADGHGLTQINTCTRTPRLLEHGTDILLLPELYCVGVCVGAWVLRVRWQMVVICLPVCTGDNWLIRKMSQTVNDEM